MIDTISLELHGTKKYEVIVNLLRITKGGYKKYDGRGTTLDHEILMPETSRHAKEKFMYKIKDVASSHYKIIISVDWFNDVIKWNFSIPKYFYGHNIAQSIQNVNEPKFNFTAHSFNEIVDLGHERLWSYIITFFDNEFPTVKVDYEDLQIKRLDFCYNQIFRTKHDALEYLELQKTVKKKNMRNKELGDSGMHQIYDTSIFFKNQDYSVKIYHKGTEYGKNDKKEHDRINSIKKQQIFDTGYLQEISDRILRYEITIRPSYMSYLFNSNIFRCTSAQFKTWKKAYNQIKAIYKKNENKKFFESNNINEQIKLLVPNLKKFIDKKTDLNFIQLMQFKFSKKVSPNISDEMAVALLKRFYSEFDVLIHTRRKFFFKLSHHNRKEELVDNQTNKNGFQTLSWCTFDKRVYNLMAKKLKEFIIDMRIDQKQPISHYIDKINEHNKKMKRLKELTKDAPEYAKGKYKEFNKPKLVMLLIALQNNSIETIRNLTNISESTFYEYQSQLKKIGYTKNTKDNLHIQVPKLDFKEYFIETATNQYKFFSNQFIMLKNRSVNLL